LRIDRGEVMADIDGTYELAFDIDGYDGNEGWLTIVDNKLRGGDSRYTLEGTLRSTAGNVSATLNIDLHPGVSGNQRINGPFVMSASGSYGPDGLNLLGTGPLGIIIELRATEARR